MDKIIRIDNGSTSITFICIINGSSSFSWERKTGRISSDAEGTDSNYLMLHNILPSDSGQYRCVGRNKHGITYSNYAVLTVKGTYHQSLAIYSCIVILSYHQ